MWAVAVVDVLEVATVTLRLTAPGLCPDSLGLSGVGRFQTINRVPTLVVVVLTRATDGVLCCARIATLDKH